MLDARIKPQRKTLMALADAFSRKNDVAGVRDVHSLAMQGAQDLRMRDIDRLTLSYMRCGDTASIEKLLDLTRNRQVRKSSMDRVAATAVFAVFACPEARSRWKETNSIVLICG